MRQDEAWQADLNLDYVTHFADHTLIVVLITCNLPFDVEGVLTIWLTSKTIFSRSWPLPESMLDSAAEPALISTIAALYKMMRTHRTYPHSVPEGLSPPSRSQVQLNMGWI